MDVIYEYITTDFYNDPCVFPGLIFDKPEEIRFFGKFKLLCGTQAVATLQSFRKPNKVKKHEI